LFLQAGDRLINLQNVSNINLLRDRKRIVFNMNYNIQINSRNGSKLISDYVYWDCDDSKEFQHNMYNLTTNEYFVNNFIDKINYEGYINLNEISSIKYSFKKNRVIFNLSHPVTFTDFDGRDKITSEFVYVNCKDSKQFSEYSEYIEKTLGEKNGN